MSELHPLASSAANGAASNVEQKVENQLRPTHAFPAAQSIPTAEIGTK